MHPMVSMMIAVVVALAHVSMSEVSAPTSMEVFAARATFESVAADGCTQTNIEVDAQSANRDENSILAITSFIIGDRCTGERLADGSGQAFDIDLRVHPTFRSAILTGVVPLDTCQGAACPLAGDQLTVNLIFIGVGDTDSAPSGSRSRDATATGMISDGHTNFAPDSSISGRLYRP